MTRPYFNRLIFVLVVDAVIGARDVGEPGQYSGQCGGRRRGDPEPRSGSTAPTDKTRQTTAAEREAETVAARGRKWGRK